MAYSKNELGTINTLYFPKKNFILHPYLPITATSAQRPLSSFCPPARKPRTQISLCFFFLGRGRSGYEITGKVAVVERFDCTCWNKGTLFWAVLRRKIDRSGIILSAVPSRTSKSRLQLLHFAALVACLCGGQVREASTPRVELRGHSPLFVSEIVPRV